MARIEAVTIPRWGMTMTEGTIVHWMVDEGSAVERGQELIEIETTKVTNVVESAAAGILRRIVLAAGITAPVGAIAGVIAEAGATEAEVDAFVEVYAARTAAAEGDVDAAIAPRTIAVGDGEVNLLEVGTAGDETVVFLHGFGGDLSTWLFNQPTLAETVHTVAIDLPGHGASTPITGGDAFDGLVARVGAAIDAITPGRVHLIGHSLGGGVAAAVGVQRSDRLASLTLLAPIGLGTEMNHAFLKDFIEAERRRPLTKVLERLFADPSKITSDMVEGTLRFKRLEGVPEALSAIAVAIADDAGRQRQAIGSMLEGLDCPVTVIWGEEDRIVPPPARDSLGAHIGLTLIPGVGHMPQMEATSEVNSLILKTIGRA